MREESLRIASYLTFALLAWGCAATPVEEPDRGPLGRIVVGEPFPLEQAAHFRGKPYIVHVFASW